MYKCIKSFSIEKADEDVFMSEEYMTISQGSIWDIPDEEDYRFIGGKSG